LQADILSALLATHRVRRAKVSPATLHKLVQCAFDFFSHTAYVRRLSSFTAPTGRDRTRAPPLPPSASSPLSSSSAAAAMSAFGGTGGGDDAVDASVVDVSGNSADDLYWDVWSARQWALVVGAASVFALEVVLSEFIKRVR
jgi:hypothetical protein